MNYRVVKYKKKRRCPFETYEPKKRMEVNKENAVPLFVRICHGFVMLGGGISFLASSFLLGIKGVFGVEKKVKGFSLNKKFVEVRVKKR